MIEHSRLPPSSAARRVACPGSRALEARFPQDESPASREGTAAHYIASYLLATNVSEYRIATAPNGEILTEEMFEGAQLYASHILKECKHDASKLHVEERVSIANIHPDCFGTPDAWFYDEDTGSLHIYDYKFGHAAVEVYENWQLIEYAAGIIASLPWPSLAAPVVFTIVQPRSYHYEGVIRKWTTTVGDLEPYFNKLRDIEEIASREHALCAVSTECNNCSARFMCRTLQEAALNVADQAFLNTGFDLHVETIGRQLQYLRRAAKLLDARITGLEQEAISRLQQGQLIPGYTLEPAGGRQVWKKSHGEIVSLGELYSVNLEKKSTITPKQAVKLGIPDFVIDAYSETTPGTLKLTEVDTHKTQKIFGGSIHDSV